MNIAIHDMSVQRPIIISLKKKPFIVYRRRNKDHSNKFLV
jgi:hypothetical protein